MKIKANEGYWFLAQEPNMNNKNGLSVLKAYILTKKKHSPKYID